MNWPSVGDLKDLVYSFWGIVFASMLAGEYIKPGRIISNFLDNVRGRF